MGNSVMTSPLQTRNDNYVSAIKKSCVKSVEICRPVVNDIVIPQAKKCLVVSKVFCTRLLIPGVKTGSKHIRQELKNIHHNENWFKRCGLTLSGNVVGLVMALSSTKIVDHFVEVRELGNLWGLLAARPVVSDTTYEVLSFLVEFIVALIVFTVTNHYYKLLSQRDEDIL